ncbi:MAG: hypothetical protein HQK92_13040 [Nitrospirae bacterium]|nr:hypothetical protein [Nitrospirota bacterium]
MVTALKEEPKRNRVVYASTPINRGNYQILAISRVEGWCFYTLNNNVYFVMGDFTKPQKTTVNYMKSIFENEYLDFVYVKGMILKDLQDIKSFSVDIVTNTLKKMNKILPPLDVVKEIVKAPTEEKIMNIINIMKLEYIPKGEIKVCGLITEELLKATDFLDTPENMHLSTLLRSILYKYHITVIPTKRLYGDCEDRLKGVSNLPDFMSEDDDGEDDDKRQRVEV